LGAPANTDLILLYYKIGKIIIQKQEKSRSEINPRRPARTDFQYIACL